MDNQLKPSAALFDVYLRLRPSSAIGRERFLDIDPESHEHAPTHITIKPPANDTRKRAVERFAFTRVFEEHVGQRELFEGTGVLPLVEGVLGAAGREGRDGLLATLGVTGSGKSHTILGSRSQRGLTQLTLDVLFQRTAPFLADVESSPTVYPSLCAADVSESQLLPAAHFLDSIYSDSAPSRATTPALVRYSPAPGYIPGAFPLLHDYIPSTSTSPCSRSVFDRLYTSLHRKNIRESQILHKKPRLSTIRSVPKSMPITRNVSRLTSILQENSFLSPPPSSRKYVPRVSALPQYPPVDDVVVDVDSSAEYAIVISMYEVYNDRIFDLLTASVSGKTPQKRRALLFKSTEYSPDRKVVAGLRKVICSDLEEALLVLETGLHERRVAGTGSNATSSRSHGFFCLDIKKRRRGTIPGPWTSSTLTIVDLAGSERARTAKTAGATLAEAGKINESLMYLGQCMQMQSDNAHATTPNLVPFRQCKLTELLFSNSFAAHGNIQHAYKAPQKAIMIVAADPLGDFNATSQILRYSALAREVTVPRIPSVTSTILAGSAPRSTDASGRVSPSAIQEDLELAFAEIGRLREDLEVAQLRLAEETQRRQEAESSWRVANERLGEAETRMQDLEGEVREEVWAEMEARLSQEQRRWRAAREEELDRQDEHLDRKLEIMAQGISIYEDESAEKENTPVVPVRRVDEQSPTKTPDTPGVTRVISGSGKEGESIAALDDENARLEAENARLRELVQTLERQAGERQALRSPSKKMRVLKTKKWEGEGLGVEDV